MSKMASLYVLLVVVAAVSASYNQKCYLNEEFNIYKRKFKKQYENNAEECYRMKNYLINKHIIEKHNARYERGLVSFSLKINQFSDMTHQEYLNNHRGFIQTRMSRRN